MNYKIYSDGCHLKEFNTACAGGYAIKDGNIDSPIFEFSEVIKDSTIFHLHEQFGVKTALEKCIEHDLQGEKIDFFSDDQTLMRILSQRNNGIDAYALNCSLLQEVCLLCEQFKDISFHHIPRNENKKADSLSRLYLLESLFKEHQRVEGAFYHRHWITKNNFSKNDTLQFNQEKKLLTNFLVVHLLAHKVDNKLLKSMEIYYAQKKTDPLDPTCATNIEYNLQEKVSLPAKGWQAKSIQHITEHLEKIYLKDKSLGFVLNDGSNLLDPMLRGRIGNLGKCQKPLEQLSKVLDNLTKVIVHRDKDIYEAIFNDSAANMKPKKPPTIR